MVHHPNPSRTIFRLIRLIVLTVLVIAAATMLVTKLAPIYQQAINDAQNGL
jgi:hypothetical protein